VHVLFPLLNQVSKRFVVENSGSQAQTGVEDRMCLNRLFARAASEQQAK
jgi:hypothetical protein